MIPVILEKLLFRLAAVVSGYYYGLSGDPVYLLIAAVYLLRNVWCLASDYRGGVDKIVAKHAEVVPLLKVVDMGNPAHRKGATLGITIASMTRYILPPFIYVYLGITSSRPTTEVLSIVVIAVLLVGVLAQTVLMYPLIKKLEK